MELFQKQAIKEIAHTLQHSITKRLLIVVFSIYLIITVIVTTIHMRFEYQSSKKQTIESLANIKDMLHDSLSQAIWEFNSSQIDAILKGLLSNQYIVGMRLEIPSTDKSSDLNNKQMGLVEDENGDLIYINPYDNKIEEVHNAFKSLIPYVFPIEHTDSLNRNLIIGKMYLYSSNAVVFDQVEESYILIIINAVIKTIALWGFFLWAGYHYISKPLSQLNDAIKRLANGSWNTGLNYKTTENKKTEINTLFDTFNEMTQNLHNTEEKLRNSRNRLNIIFETMPSALLSINSNNIIQGWNKGIEKITGIDAKTAIGKHVQVIFPAFNEYVHLIKDAIEDNKEQKLQHVRISPHKIENNCLYQITVYPLLKLMPPEVVIRIDDVTDQVQNTASLTQVEKLASVGASIAGVAHEINNPLAAIMLSTQNIQRRLDPNMEANQVVANNLQTDLKKNYQYLEAREIIKFLNDIHSSSERASSIIKNMLRFTRRSTAEMSIHYIEDIINDSIEIAAHDLGIQEHINFKSIKIEKSFCAPQVSIMCYPLEIQQVLLNLIRNASQAFDPGQKDKILSISMQKIGNNKISIEVKDNGSGIEEAILTQIFQPFFTTKPVGHGTGLGLSVCKNIIVQRHHGNLEVKSTLGQGTTFTITLPMQHLAD